MSQPLVPCVACNRHVFADASACPFCGGRPGTREVPPAPASPGRPHLGRAALLAAGAALVGATACSSSVVPLYGVPPDYDASYDAPSSTGGKGGGGAGGQGGVAGAPAERDAGSGRLVVPLSDPGAPMPRKRGP